MHVLYFDAVKRQKARQTEGERHTDRDFITFILFILCFYIDGRERDRETERERDICILLIRYLFLLGIKLILCAFSNRPANLPGEFEQVFEIFVFAI